MQTQSNFKKVSGYFSIYKYEQQIFFPHDQFERTQFHY
jgi:hypothetical protein